MLYDGDVTFVCFGLPDGRAHPKDWAVCPTGHSRVVVLNFDQCRRWNRGWRGAGVALARLTFDPIVARITLFSDSPRVVACATIVALPFVACQWRGIGCGFALAWAMRRLNSLEFGVHQVVDLIRYRN